jgi:arylsulfatase A-like enzyme/cytochrome c-type biogenesis protein CcmH/NrfG
MCRRRPLVAAVALLAAAGFEAGCRRPAPPRHLLLVTLDTFRADRAGAYGHRGGLTPHLDRLAGEGVRFEAAWSSAPLTLPAHATLLTGLLPVAHGLRQNGSGSLGAEVETLATRLAAERFRSGAFVGAFVLNHRFGLARGFEIYDDEIAQRPGRPAGIEAQRPGREVVDRALAWLAGRGERRLFLWVHLFDAHAPYEPPEPFRSRIEAPYDGEIAEADAQLGRLLAAFDAAGLARDTLVVVAADHGEALGEHGEPTHGLLLYEPTVRVPLVLRAPQRLEPGAVVRTPVGLVDLAPTVAALLGLDWPVAPGPASGRDLARALLDGREPGPADLYAESEYPRLFGWAPIAALRRGEAKFVWAPEPELFDLAADPGEGRNLVDARRRDASAMKAAVDALRAGALDRSTAAPDEESRRQLAALGYASGTSAPALRDAADPKRMAPLFSRLERAREAMEAGRLAEAAEELTRLVAADPGNPVFRGTRAQALRRLGRSEQAIAELGRTLGFGPGDEQTLFDLGALLHATGRRAEAERVLRELLRRDPDFAEARNTLGVLRLEAGAPAEAAAEFERALALDSGNANAANNLGNALRALGRRAEAERAHRRALELAPDWADPWNGLGALLVEIGRIEEAIQAFERALALDPSRHEARLNRAIALDSAGRRAEAERAYRDFLAAVGSDARYTPQRRAAEALLARLGRTR